MKTLFCSIDHERAEVFAKAFNQALPDMVFRHESEEGDDGQVAYLLTWDLPADLAVRFPALEVVFALGAGVDHIDWSQVPSHVKVVRMVEPGIEAFMVEYVVMAVMMAHRDIPAYVQLQQQGQWTPQALETATNRTVGIMGAGVLGTASLEALRPFGFSLRAWSRSRKNIPGVMCYGAEDLSAFLNGCDILVCLLPLTPQTRDMLDRRLLALLPAGASLVNASRGEVLVEEDLIEALESGHLRGAILDVARQEPLPQTSPLWRTPGIILTPHIGARTQASSAAQVVARQILLHQQDQPMLNLVDRRTGY